MGDLLLGGGSAGGDAAGGAATGMPKGMDATRGGAPKDPDKGEGASGTGNGAGSGGAAPSDPVLSISGREAVSGPSSGSGGTGKRTARKPASPSAAVPGESDLAPGIGRPGRPDRIAKRSVMGGPGFSRCRVVSRTSPYDFFTPLCQSFGKPLDLAISRCFCPRPRPCCHSNPAPPPMRRPPIWRRCAGRRRPWRR